jgi:phosphatidylglycerophosphate synthase
MGQLKRLIPKSRRPALAEAIKARLPEGPIRNHAADAVTITGIGLIALGAKVDGRFGMFVRMIGKFGDDLDGDLARLLGTDSRFGALLDATADKIGVAVEVPLLWKHTNERSGPTRLAHRAMIATIAAKHSTNAALNIIAMARGRESKSSGIGKVNAYLDGMAAGCMGISDVAKSSRVRTAAELSSYAFFAAGLATGTLAAIGYASDAFGPVKEGATPTQLAEGQTAATAALLESTGDPWIDASFGIAPWPVE